MFPAAAAAAATTTTTVPGVVAFKSQVFRQPDGWSKLSSGGRLNFVAALLEQIAEELQR